MVSSLRWNDQATDFSNNTPMKQIFSHSISIIPDTDPFDNQYLFQIATSVSSPIIVDLAELLKDFRNDRVEYRKDYKLWNDVYPGEKELQIFQGLVEKALSENRKIHIVNCTLREEVQMVQELYQELGYFDPKENCFVVPFESAPVTIGVNIRNLAYSTKDYKSKRESICFIPPPREPGHTKTLFAAINSGVVSTLTVNDVPAESELLAEIISLEKVSLTRFAQILHGNFLGIGCQMEDTKEWVLEMP